MLGMYYLRHHGMDLTYLTRLNKGSEVQNRPNYRHKKNNKIKKREDSKWLQYEFRQFGSDTGNYREEYHGDNKDWFTAKWHG